MFQKLMSGFTPELEIAEAHCDAPCGVYDPSSARVAAEAVLSLTKKILDLKAPDGSDPKATANFHNTLTRYIMIKEEQARVAKDEILILWTDYFKPVHLEKFPNLHDTFWKAAKAASAAKVEVSLEHATELMDYVKQIHEMFWSSKDRHVEWYTAS